MPKVEDPLVQLATRIPKRVHRELKLHCVTSETTVMEFLIEALKEQLAREGQRRRSSRS
jgi:predicted HicB family RNase H-like nuclease